MVHDYHDALLGYDPRQIWHDGCGECEHRGASVPDSIGTLDLERSARAWYRMQLWVNDDLEVLGPLSRAELPLLRFLESVQNINRLMGYAGIDVRVQS